MRKTLTCVSSRRQKVSRCRLRSAARGVALFGSYADRYASENLAGIINAFKRSSALEISVEQDPVGLRSTDCGYDQRTTADPELEDRGQATEPSQNATSDMAAGTAGDINRWTRHLILRLPDQKMAGNPLQSAGILNLRVPASPVHFDALEGFATLAQLE